MPRKSDNPENAAAEPQDGQAPAPAPARPDAANLAAGVAQGDQDAIRQQREQDAQRKQDEVKAREEQIAAAFAPSDHPDVAVAVKQTERAARAEQERLDTARAAAAGQQPEPPPPPPPTEGTLPPEYANPSVHPVVPSPDGSAPHGELPAGPQDEDVVYVTNDIAPDGTPLIQGQAQAFVEPTPHINAEDDKDYPDANVSPAVSPDDLPVRVNQHSEEGARLDEIKTGQRTVYVPTPATLDPVSGRGTV